MMHNFIHKINRSVLIRCLLYGVCCTIGDKDINGERFLFSRNLSLRLTFISFYSPTVSFVFLMSLSLKMTVMIGLSYGKYCCHLSPAATPPGEQKSLMWCSLVCFCLGREYSNCFQSSQHIPSIHICRQKGLFRAKYVLFSKN